MNVSRVTRLGRCYDLKKLQKSFAKNGVLAQTTVSFCKNLIIALVFEKNANFFAEHWQKSQKIVLITSTPDWAIFYSCRQNFLAIFLHRISYVCIIKTKLDWVTFWAILLQTHLVTLNVSCVTLYNFIYLGSFQIAVLTGNNLLFL
jgi:hypothetical protein